MPESITASALGVDLSPRLQQNTTIVGSPAAAAETIIASITLTGDPAVIQGIRVVASAAWTVGTSGTTSTLRIRQTDTSGTILASTGAVTTAAASLRFHDLYGFDTAPVLPGQIYVATLQVANGAAESTVSGVFIGVTII